MKTPIILYRVIRIDAAYDPAITDKDAAKNAALESFLAEAQSNALYNGARDGVKITDITDCGESA